MAQEILIALALGAVSLLYATAGQAGGTGFLAAMGMAGIADAQLRPTALCLNILAAGYATVRLRGVLEPWVVARVTLPSLPGALLGGMVVLPPGPYRMLTGALLVAAAALMLRRPSAPAAADRLRAGPAALAGAAAGVVSGLTGVGGGVFLVPVLVGCGWASARRAALLSPPFILANSVLGLCGVTLAGQGPSPALAAYAVAVVAGAAAGTAVGLRWMTERTTRAVLALLLVLAGMRLLLR